MSKKIWYSSPLNLFWKEIYPVQKRLTPYFSDEQIYYMLKKKNAYDGMKLSAVDSREDFLIGLEMWWQDYEKNLLHVFFQEKVLKEFLEAMPLADLSGVSQYLYENGDDRTVIYLAQKEKTNCVVYCYGIHIPYETEGYAFQFSVFNNGTVELAWFHGKTFGALSDRMYSDLLNKDDAKSKTLVHMFKLAINTIAYMKCFPECVVDGVPKITISRDENRASKNVILGISKKLAENEYLGKKHIPHFRRGHFRMLRSDYYKNRQGDLVFIHETMVNGKSKTLYTAKNLNQFESLNE